jgi:hypothetical protein
MCNCAWAPPASEIGRLRQRYDVVPEALMPRRTWIKYVLYLYYSLPSLLFVILAFDMEIKKWKNVMNRGER